MGRCALYLLFEILPAVNLLSIGSRTHRYHNLLRFQCAHNFIYYIGRRRYIIIHSGSFTQVWDRPQLQIYGLRWHYATYSQQIAPALSSQSRLSIVSLGILLINSAHRTDTKINILITYVINTGLLTSLCAICSFVSVSLLCTLSLECHTPP